MQQMIHMVVSSYVWLKIWSYEPSDVQYVWDNDEITEHENNTLFNELHVLG